MINYKSIENYITNQKYLTNFVGIARTVLAFGLLLTLLLNSNATLFNTGLSNSSVVPNSINFFSIFCLITNIQIAKTLSILALLLIIIGIYPRYTCILHFWITFSFSTCVQPMDGGDQIATIITFLLIPICLINRNRWHWHTIESKNFYVNTIAFYTLTLIKIQAIVIYFHAAVGKFAVTEWLNGSAIYYWFNDPVFGLNSLYKPFFKVLLKNPIITFYLNWSVIFLELFIVIAILSTSKKIKKYALFLGLFFHFFIIIVHGLASFYFSMASLLMVDSINKCEFLIIV